MRPGQNPGGGRRGGAAPAPPGGAGPEGTERPFYPGGPAFSAGRLVSVSAADGETVLKARSSSRLSGTVSRDGSSLGSYDFADGVEILDVDDEGGYVRIYPDRLAGAQLSDSDVRYYSLNEHGEIDRLILNEATGDTYTYGYLIGADVTSSGLDMTATYTYLLDGEKQTLTTSGKTLGASYGPARLTIENRQLASVRALSQIRNPDAITQLGVTKDGESWLFSDECTVYLYQNTQYSLISLTELRNNFASYNITCYYDKDTDDGGRIRIVIARPQ